MKFASSSNVDVKKKIIIFFIVSLFIFIIDASNKKYFQPVRAVINDSVIYSINTVKLPLLFVADSSKSFFNLFKKDENSLKLDQFDGLKDKVEDLKNKNLVLEKRIQYFQDIVREEKYNFPSQLAKTIIFKENIFNNMFVVNKGSLDGVKIGDPVIKNNVLVGKIIEANFKSSQAILLTNINSRVPVRIGSMKYNAILNGHESEKNNLKLTFLPKEYSFVGGEIIYTTSIDGIMPEGLIIGEIKLDKNKKFYIQPFYEVNKLDLVSIINLKKN
jgi:rod shape-determining protein MreC